MANLLPSSIQNKPHLAAFDTMIEQRFIDLDFTPVLMNLVDTCSVDALPYLLKQFDVLGYKGLRFIDPLSITYDTDRRELIKKAIELKKHRGTTWSIKEALKLIGITNCEIHSNASDYFHDGFYLRDGTILHALKNWATFTLKVNAATFSTITTGLVTDIVNIVNEYKAGRSHLVRIVGLGIMHNGIAYRDGTYTRDTQLIII